MNIILVSGKLAKARTLTLTIPHLIFGSAATLMVFMILAFGLQYYMLRYAASLKTPLLNTLLLSAQQEQNDKMQDYLRENLNAMAAKLGQMQAQLLRLDSVGARLAELSGMKPQEFLFNQSPGQGGALPTLPTQDLSFVEMGNKIQELSAILDDRSDKLGALDSLLMQDRLKKKMPPS